MVSQRRNHDTWNKKFPFLGKETVWTKSRANVKIARNHAWSFRSHQKTRVRKKLHKCQPCAYAAITAISLKISLDNTEGNQRNITIVPRFHIDTLIHFNIIRFIILSEMFFLPLKSFHDNSYGQRALMFRCHQIYSMWRIVKDRKTQRYTFIYLRIFQSSMW